MIKAILFDLDGTLLPMDQDYFISTYMKGLAKKLVTLTPLCRVSGQASRQ